MKIENKPKILFVQDTIGHLSEVFSYRLLTGITLLDVKILTRNYINQDHFPFDPKKIYIRNHKNVKVHQKIIPYINRKFKAKGRQIGEDEVFISHINNSDADLVCFQFAFLPVNMGKDFNKIKKKTCIIHHGTDVNKAVEDGNYLQRLKLVWKKADKIIFISHFLKNIALSLGCPKEKSIVQYLGVPVLTGSLSSTEKNTAFTFICVARMSPVKNHINLIRAFAKVIEKSEADSVELILVGTGELSEIVKNEIVSLGIANYVKLMGGLPNNKVLQLISQSDSLVQVSRIYSIPGKTRQEEGLPISLLEGATMSLPLIGSKTGGIPEIIEDGKNGYLVDPLNIEDISNAMLKIALNPEKSKNMGNNAKSLVENKFNLSKQNKKFEEIFVHIIDSDKEIL